MRKLLAVAMWLALPSLGWAQCHGYSANVQYTPLSPADAAQRGQVTATLTLISNLSISQLGHAYTVTPGTWIGWIWTSNNAVSGNGYWIDQNGGQHNFPFTWGTSGSTNGVYWQMQVSDVGNTYKIVYSAKDANGNTTQDVVRITTVAGSGPSIISQDGIFTNVYVQVLTTFGGGDMMDNCAECLQAPYHCIHATHTPYVTMTAVNHTSGESQALPRQVAGIIADATSSISGSGSIMISALPNDIVDGTFNDEIICSVVGPFPVTGNDDWHVQWEWAWTKVSTIQKTCTQSGKVVICKVTSQYTCSQASSPADLQPATVISDFSGVTPATMDPFWWTWAVGIRPRVTGFPWLFPTSNLLSILQSDYFILDILSGAFPSNSTVRDCTNYDKGTVPSPWPPFDQP